MLFFLYTLLKSNKFIQNNRTNKVFPEYLILYILFYNITIEKNDNKKNEIPLCKALYFQQIVLLE